MLRIHYPNLIYYLPADGDSSLQWIPLDSITRRITLTGYT